MLDDLMQGTVLPTSREIPLSEEEDSAPEEGEVGYYGVSTGGMTARATDVWPRNPDLLRFSVHWGFRIRACRPYRAQPKGKLERPVRYIRGNFFYGRISGRTAI